MGGSGVGWPRDGWPRERWMAQIGVWMGNTLEWCAVHRGVGDGGTATYFIQHDRYFDRDGL